METLTVDVTPAVISEWLECCINMRTYASVEENPLLDVIKSRDGTEIKICLISGKESV